MNDVPRIIITCPVCKGKAKDPSYSATVHPCPRSDYNAQITIDADAEVCATCGGSGRNNNYRATTVLCPSCHGDGHVVTPRVLALRKSKVHSPISKSETLRIHIDDIDSFSKVRDIDTREVSKYLDKGRFDMREEKVKKCIEGILSLTLDQKDWAGEFNDLYSSTVLIGDNRVPTAFMLKGNGLKVKEMRLRHCGKNGDQIQRLFLSPAELNVIQYIDHVGQDVIRDAEDKAALLNKQGKRSQYCIIDGHDTARLMKAYCCIK